MKQDQIDDLLGKGLLFRVSPDVLRANTLIKSAVNRADSAAMLQITHVTSTTVFAEVYEAFRQVGEAKWIATGYKTNNSHEASILILIEAPVKNSHRLINLDRFRKIRNKANYEGMIVPPENAKEIMDLWKDTSKELIGWIEK